MSWASKVLTFLLWLCAAAFVAGMCALYLSSVFMGGPLQPQPQRGKVIGWNNHGALHYITAEQSEAEAWIFRGVVALFFLCCGHHCAAATPEEIEHFERKEIMGDADGIGI